VRNSAASSKPPESQNAFPNKSNAAFSNLGLAQNSWLSAIEEMLSYMGAREFKKYRFRDVTVISAREDRTGAIQLTLRSPAPEKAQAGIAKHEAAIYHALSRFYGRTVKLLVIGNELPSAPPGQ
jgi:hypothetical protein